MLWLWHFILGYLCIKIDSNNGTAILNCAAANNIIIWDLYYKNGYILGKISVKNFLKLYSIKKSIKCRISIVKKCGIYFRIKKYKKRIGIIIGAMMFAIILLILSKFIWIINIEGNDKIPVSQILLSCKKIGICAGVPKKSISNKYDAQKLQLMDTDIAWCSLNVEGCVLTVNISETITSDQNEKQTPSNLKALTDGKIKSIDISSGNSLVKVGDIVSRGDLLVSGIIEHIYGNIFVHSSGKIIAETQRVFSAHGNFSQTITQETGETISRYTVKIFNLKIPLYLGNVKKTCNYEKKINNITLFDKAIPITIVEEKYRVTEKVKVNYDDEKLMKILYDNVQKQLDEFNFLDAVETSRETIKTENGILLKIMYNCEENIAVQDDILLSKEN